MRVIIEPFVSVMKRCLLSPSLFVEGMVFVIPDSVLHPYSPLCKGGLEGDFLCVLCVSSDPSSAVAPSSLTWHSINVSHCQIQRDRGRATEDGSGR